MSYTLTSLDDGHIILCTLHSDLDISVDLPQFLQESYELLENGPDRIVNIRDGSLVQEATTFGSGYLKKVLPVSKTKSVL